MNIVKLKSMSLGILKIVSFVVLIFLIERILFLNHGVIPSSFWQKFDGRGLNEPLFFYSILMNLLSAFLICYIFLKYIEKKGFAFIRFSFQDMTKRFFVGSFISSSLIIFFIVIFLLLGSVSITKQLGTAFYIIVFFIFGMLTILLAAIYEEIICRGYILRTLENHFDQRTAIFLSSLFFSAVHLLNPNSSVLGSINLFLSAIILAIVTIHFNNLWLPIGLHYGWNLWLVIFNFPVSGRTFPNPIIKLSYNEYNIIVGNKFGPEDSILLTVIMVILIGYFLFKHRSKDRVTHTNNL